MTTFIGWALALLWVGVGYGAASLYYDSVRRERNHLRSYIWGRGDNSMMRPPKPDFTIDYSKRWFPLTTLGGLMGLMAFAAVCVVVVVVSR